jgi:hypothetical protein
MNHADKKLGFTLIELMLAMGFVSALLIAIAMTVIQIGNIYNKGLTLKEVNQAGRSLASELQKSIAQSSPFDVIQGAGSRYIAQNWGGRLCIGQYSYIWNYGSAIKTGDTARLNTYSDSRNEIRFVKVSDSNASYCTASMKKVDTASATELLNVGEHDLAVHSFVISAAPSAGDQKTGQQLYSIEFIIGTNDQLALTNISGAVACKAPSQPGADPSYCSVNKFDIVALAGNSVQ